MGLPCTREKQLFVHVYDNAMRMERNEAHLVVVLSLQQIIYFHKFLSSSPGRPCLRLVS